MPAFTRADRADSSRRRAFEHAAIALVAAIALAVGVSACDPKPLPEQGTYAEQTYASRCGRCHAPYPPRAMTPAMWQLQVRMMQGKMVQAGIAPLSERDRALILDYLTRNAGHQ